MTYATRPPRLPLIQGVHPRVVMELLGQSQLAVTMNLYSHVVPALRREVADQMDAIFQAKPPVATSVATNPGKPLTN